MRLEHLERRVLLSGTIEGTVFVDVNGDGAFDAGDQPRQGIVAYLDANENGQFDDGEIAAVSNAAGLYRFENIEPGDHIVALDEPSGLFVNQPNQNRLRLLSSWDGTVGGQHDDHDDGGKGGAGKTWGDVWTEGNLAILGHSQTDGMVDIIDISDRANPIHMATYDGGGQRFQDVKLHGGIGYFGSDSGGGVHIVDLHDPVEPTLLTTITTADGGHNQIHNLFIADGYLYQASGRSTDVRVFDVSDPANPVHVRNIATTDPRLIHDITVANGRLYTSGFGTSTNGGTTDIFDVSDIGDPTWSVATRLLGTIHSGVNNHSNWPTADGNVIAIAREVSGGGDVTLWDIRDPSQPQLLSTITGASLGLLSATPHNPVIRGDLLYVSWYHNGLVVLDISDPTQPVMVGNHDTLPGTGSSGFDGNWGVHLAGRDQVTISDMRTGLYVLEMAAPFSNVVTLESGETVGGKDFALVDTASPWVTEMIVQNDEPQRSMVTQIEFGFSEDVSASISAAGLIVQDMDTFETLDPALFEAHTHHQPNHATWHFHDLPGGSLPDGNWLITLDTSGVTDAQGNPLEPMTPVEIHRYYGDSDGDRDVDFSDLFAFRSSYQLTDADPGFVAHFDHDADGDVDALELFAFRQRLQTTLAPPVAEASQSSAASTQAAELESPESFQAVSSPTASPSDSLSVLQTASPTRTLLVAYAGKPGDSPRADTSYISRFAVTDEEKPAVRRARVFAVARRLHG